MRLHFAVEQKFCSNRFSISTLKPSFLITCATRKIFFTESSFENKRNLFCFRTNWTEFEIEALKLKFEPTQFCHLVLSIGKYFVLLL